MGSCSLLVTRVVARSGTTRAMPGDWARPWIPRHRSELTMRLTTLLTAVLPPLTGFQIDQVRVAEAEITVTVHPQRRRARCSLCQRRARRVHSRYTRTGADLSWGSPPGRVPVQAR